MHAGLITLANGGVVQIEIAPGAPGYLGTWRNGVTTHKWAAWYGSYVFVR